MKEDEDPEVYKDRITELRRARWYGKSTNGQSIKQKEISNHETW